MLQNIFKESLKKTIIEIHQQSSEETYDTIEDSTYKKPIPRHEDETEFEDELLMKRFKKIKQVLKLVQSNSMLDQRNMLELNLKKKGEV